MTTGLAVFKGIDSGHTYQHIIGLMLINFNRLASQLNLTHTEYRLMSVLIGHYNKIHNKAFPTIEYLADQCCMGKQTIIKALNNLVELGLLIVVKTPGKRNNYYFSNQIISTPRSIHVKPPCRITCNTTHDNKLTEDKTNKEQASCNQNNNDDISIKKFDSAEYKQVLIQLEKWSFSGGKFTIKKHGLKKLKSLIEQTRQNNPSSPGAYLRSLLSLPDHNLPESKIEPLKMNLNDGLKTTKEILTINEPRLSRQEIINNLLLEEKTEEAAILVKLWKVKMA